jgi:hypothetical protein
MTGKIHRFLTAVVLASLSVPALPRPASAAPGAETLKAWQQYTATFEAKLGQTRGANRAAPAGGLSAAGESVPVPSGTISHWRGAVFLRGMTLDRLLNGLMHPGTPPPQADVVASRVLARGDKSLRVYIRLVRHAIVTATYDTEHEMTFTRHSPTLATARSVATRIDEVGGSDRGFLWRLNSYWRYEQRPDGVLVELESLTLSRSVPALARPIAMPLVNKVARESMTRTLDALKQHFERST